MKTVFKIVGILILILTAQIRSGLSQDFIFSEKWEEYKDDHFIMYYDKSIPKTYIKKFAKECEKDYETVLDRLGFSRMDFWLFKDRAKVYLFKDRDEYLEKTGFPEFSAGAANYEDGYIAKKTIVTYFQNKGFFENLLPHELTHIMLEDFIGANTDIPLWFNEGLACSNEQDREKYIQEVKKIMKEDHDLSKTISPGMEAHKFYAISASYVIYLLREYGREKFVLLCKKLKNRKPFNNAFEEVYGFKNLDELRIEFLQYVR